MITRIDKEELLGILKTNRAEHRAIFEEAVSGYRERAIELLEEHIVKIKSNKRERIHIVLPEPADHTSEYDRAIRMIEMNEEGSVELEEHEFAQLVLDDWGWQRQFLATNSTYSAMAAEKFNA